MTTTAQEINVESVPPLEAAYSFGDGSALTGVYTPASIKNVSEPCALFLTAGLLHHIGPTRLHVEMARKLSEQGVAGMRFDLSGAGDSETGSLGGYFMDRSVDEIKQAMDFLQERHGHRHFVLVGLCSGADDGLATAQQDERVAGLVLLNGYAYHAGWFRAYRALKFYLPRLFDWQKIKNRVTKLFVKESGLTKKSRAALTELDDDFRYIPPQESTETVLTTLCELKTDLLFVYTGSEHEDYSYKGQLYAMFPNLRKNPHVTERYLQQADHTLLLQADRDIVTNWVCDWFARASFDRTKRSR